MTETTIKTAAKKPTLNERLAAIQKELKAPKNQFNKFGNYNYRSCEDILEAVKPLLGDLTLIVRDDIKQVGDRYYVEATVVLTDGDNAIDATAFAREADTKAGMDVAQITGAASSYARKYALNGLFLIDDTKDADTQDNSVKAPEAKPATPQAVGSYPASSAQLAWVDKILKGRQERQLVTNDQLKKLSSKNASDFIGGKITTEQMLKTIGVEYQEQPEDEFPNDIFDGEVAQ